MWSFKSTFNSLAAPLGFGAGARRPEPTISEVVKELASFEDYQLADIGLCRSDLTPEGLTVAGMRRRLEQARMEAERAVATSVSARAA